MKREELKELRLKMNLTQKEVAKQVGISRPMYTSIENGNRNPSMETLQGLYEVFGEDIKNIFFDNEVA